MTVTRDALFNEQLLHVHMEVYDRALTSLSQELNDNLGQLLSTSKMLLGLTERGMDSKPDTLMTAGETLGKAIQEVRLLSKFLLSVIPGKFDLIDNLEKEIDSLRSQDTIEIHFTGNVRLPLAADIQMILFRVVQQAIENAVQHTSAKRLYVQICLSIDKLRLAVREDGSELMNNKPEPSVLDNMVNRINMVGGQIQWINTEAAGTEVIIQLSI